MEMSSEDPIVIQLFLQLLYEGKTDLPTFGEHMIPLFKLAHKYQVECIFNMCETFLIRNINAFNAIEVYGVAKLLESADLMYITLLFIERFVKTFYLQML